MRVAIKFLTKPSVALRAFKCFELLVHLLDVLVHVAAQTELHVASSVRALERAIFSVRAHMEEKLRFIRQHLVTVTSVLALEKSSAINLTAALSFEAEHGVGLTTWLPLRIS